MTPDEHAQLNTVANAICAHIFDVGAVMDREQARLDAMPRFTEVKLERRIRLLKAALDGLDQAYGELAAVIADDPDHPQVIMHIEPRP